jgi:hypothetical protein
MPESKIAGTDSCRDSALRLQQPTRRAGGVPYGLTPCFPLTLQPKECLSRVGECPFLTFFCLFISHRLLNLPISSG